MLFYQAIILVSSEFVMAMNRSASLRWVLFRNLLVMILLWVGLNIQVGLQPLQDLALRIDHIDFVLFLAQLFNQMKTDFTGARDNNLQWFSFTDDLITFSILNSTLGFGQNRCSRI